LKGEIVWREPPPLDETGFTAKKREPFRVNPNIAKRYSLNPKPVFTPETTLEPNPPQELKPADSSDPITDELRTIYQKEHAKNNPIEQGKPKIKPSKVELKVQVVPPLPYDELAEIKQTLERLGAQGTLEIEVLEKAYGPNKKQSAKIKKSTFQIPINIASEKDGKEKEKKVQPLPKGMEFLKGGTK